MDRESSASEVGRLNDQLCVCDDEGVRMSLENAVAAGMTKRAVDASIMVNEADIELIFNFQ